MHLGMRQVEAAAQRMAELVMQPHRHRAQRRAGEPGAVERVAARLDVLGLAHDDGERPRQRAQALRRHQRGDGVGVLGIERLDAMGDGVHARRARHLRRQPHREIGIVDHDARLRLGVARGALQPALGHAVDRRHLRARIGRGHGDDGQLGVDRDRLGEADGRAAADRDDAVGGDAARRLARGARRLGRHMHHRLGMDAGGGDAEAARRLVGELALARRRQHQRALGAERLHFVGEPVDGAGAEHHARGKQVIDETAHHHSLRKHAVRRATADAPTSRRSTRRPRPAPPGTARRPACRGARSRGRRRAAWLAPPRARRPRRHSRP